MSAQRDAPEKATSAASRVDYVNIGLVVLSLVLAHRFPFELFLIAYALLGPLHYMTEIGWLHKKRYFVKRDNGYIVLIVLAVLFFLSYSIDISRTEDFGGQLVQGLVNTPWEPIVTVLPSWSSGFVFLAFLFGLAMALIPNRRVKIVLLATGLILAVVLKDARPYIILFSLLLPTVIHVCVFTGLFMLYGALRSRSRPGLAAVGVYAVCIASFFFMAVSPGTHEVSEYTERAFTASQFGALNTTLSEILGFESVWLNDGVGLNIQRFIAFIYTYHYLNWFSKTKVIQWHSVSKRWMIITAITWIASVSVYAYDYRTGFMALLLLSIVHVFLEFPLNHRSLVGVGSELAARLRRAG